MRLRSERIVTSSGTIAGELSIRGGSIVAVGPVGTARAGGPGIDADAPTVDVGGAWIVPGYIDTHVHGGGGAQCNTADPDELAAVAGFHAAHGTTALLATTAAAPVQELVSALEATASAHGRARQTGARRMRARQTGAIVLGNHLEGPFLSRKRPGAMDPETFLDPDPQTVERLLRAGAGTLKYMTLAPELPGATELVRELVRAGAVASIGHSDATYDQTLGAVRAGARAATHTFNAMAPLHHRAPGVLGAVLDLPEVSVELICDGVHVSPAVLRLAYRAKGRDRVRLVTDAIQGAGMPDGEYRLAGAPITVTGGRATLRSDGSIAGSTLTMGAAVRNAVRFLGITVEDAVALASANPAKLLGLEGRKGAIAAGGDADLVVLDEDLWVRGTLVAGEWVNGPPSG
jgi:N-acetylglucosamine-6-phosphate deacetylase